MAILSKIRENTILVLVVISLGIALFVMMDMQGGNQGGAVRPAMGEVGDRSVDRNEFERTLSAVFSGGDPFQNRDQLWNFYLSEGVILNESEAIGLEVSEQELQQLTFGPNYSPVIRRNFGNPQTGQVDPAQLAPIQEIVEQGDRAIQDAIDQRQLGPSFRDFWKYQNREIVAQRTQEKLSAMVSRALYAPSWQAQEVANNQVNTRNLAYVQIPFDEIDNADVSVSDAEIDAYIAENRSLYVRPEEQRVLNYLVFDVFPSVQDSADLRTQMLGEKAEFESADSDSSFVLTRNGTIDANTLPRAQLSDVIADELLENMEVGQVYGPYVEGTAYKLTKLLEREVLAETANSRHILISTQPQPGQPAITMDEAQSRADSLARVLRNGGDWDVLAAEFSSDPGSKDKGGLYEDTTPGSFVPAYDNILFRTGNIGQIYTAETQFGVHVIEVLSRSAETAPRVKTATVVEPIIPSNNTEEQVRQRAQGFLAEHGSDMESLREAADNTPDLSIQRSEAMTINGYSIANLGIGQEVRDMVCFAFSARTGEVSDRLYVFANTEEFYNDKYVIAAQGDVYPAGLATAASLRDDLTPVVANRLKGDMIASQIGQAGSLAALAQQFSVEIDTLSGVSMATPSLPNIGTEPKVLAAAFSVATQQLSSPVIGNNGVYVLQPLTELSNNSSGNLPGARTQINSTARTAANNALLSALRQNSTITDDRADADCQ
ncbi:MAG: peptidylprolyl isomerase [Bacteroidota bacterium]